MPIDTIEKSLDEEFLDSIWKKFYRAVRDYKLIQPDDRIAVCISGGKDSMLMAVCLRRLQRMKHLHFDLQYIVMDPGYNSANMDMITYNADIMSLPVQVYSTKIFSSAEKTKNPCFLCARLRRGWLYKKAQELGCNKIALGHHFDDVIETILMGMLYGGQVQTMMPKLHSTNFEGMELIRPLYLVREDDIKHWRDYNGLHFIQCACKFTDTCTTCAPDSRSVSKRLEIKNLIAELKKVNPQVEKNIFRSVENVNVNTVIAYKDNEGVHRFLDTYDTKADS